MVEFEEIFDEPAAPVEQPKSAPPPSKPSKDNIVGQAVKDGVKIEADHGEKLDQQAKEEAWHWKEIDLNPFIRERLSTMFTHVPVASTHNVEVETFKAEHWGEAFATQRKGKGKLVCNFRVDVKWRGKLRLGDAVIGSCTGTIRLPEVTAEKKPEEWVLKAVCDGEDQSAMRMLNPCGSLESTPVRELEPAEQEIKEAMLTTAPKRVLEMITELMRELLQKAKARCDLPEPSPAEEPIKSDVPEEIQAQVKQTMEDMRVNHLPTKFKEMDWTQPKVELSVARLTDTEMAQVAEKLAGNETITNLDLSHNELTDIGVQQLVTCMAMGGAPNLKQLRLVSNPYGKMGQNMLAGLQAMRKGLKVTYTHP